MMYEACAKCGVPDFLVDDEDYRNTCPVDHHPHEWVPMDDEDGESADALISRVIYREIEFM